ncbi:hypothetical protein QFZ36_000521 [Pseudarthrobacter siccitolerans]|uniref:Uncharacterized protein n=1 Tax=Pseudarthrobacter siccitolerans TaxID=861266 RepID=A0ABU0PG66_9MICC|nr:hypothetical protein [Pseudarthrobacter siccitolerans]MDQ0672960.1 hypothetical protein [Pseudarthrobacter siccitolerans]
MMDFNPDTWGTVGQWASAVITGSAFFATFYVIRRDARVRLLAQARKVAYYRSQRGRFWNHTVHNLSDEPIFDVQLHVVVKGRSRELIAEKEILIPQEKLSPTEWFADSIDAEFRDNSGHWWRRTVNGKLHEVSRLQRALERGGHRVDRYGFGRTLLRSFGRKRRALAKRRMRARWRREDKRTIANDS